MQVRSELVWDEDPHPMRQRWRGEKSSFCELHARQERPLCLTKFNSLRDEPPGLFSPRSYWLTTPVETLR